jgi:hypothetical protein
MAIEDDLRAMADDPDTPAHLRLGALRELGRLQRSEPTKVNGHEPEREDGLPDDPLLAAFPLDAEEEPYAAGADPMADLDFEQIVGRMPHPLYAKVLFRIPGRVDKDTLVRAEAQFLRECRNRGLDTIDPDDDVAMRRWLRKQKRSAQ